jgi:hypothetical protein
MSEKPPPARRRRMPITRLEEMFGSLLDAREAVEQDPSRARELAPRALYEGHLLVNALLEWAAQAACHDNGQNARRPTDTAHRRRILADRLRVALLLPWWGARELANALAALEEGQVDELLQGPPNRHRTTMPYSKILAQLRLLAWIEWQTGLGTKQHEAEQRAAEAIGRARTLFDQWRHKELKERIEESRWRHWLWRAKRAGEAERNGERLFDSEWDLDREQRDLKQLAADFKQAVVPRR